MAAPTSAPPFVSGQPPGYSPAPTPHPTANPLAPRSFTTAELLNLPTREFILMVGKDGSGKSSAVVSLAKWVQDALNSAATFFVIDTENKFPTALRGFGSDAPANIKYFKTETMNDVNNAYDWIQVNRKPGDWLAVESMSRIWERSQDLGYQAVSGFTKASYLETRRAINKTAPVIPKPDDFWSIVKGAHDSAFLDPISQASSLNVILSSTISKPRSDDRGPIKENATRKEVRIEYGIDMGIDGAPRIPYYVETLCTLGVRDNQVTCRILRDNMSSRDNPRPEFPVPDKKQWAQQFWMNCR